MRELDEYSFNCGVIDCFCEIVGAGVKRLALSHPADSRAERDAYLDFSRQACERYGTKCRAEDELLLTDLFPLSMNRGKYNILYYRDDADLEEYLQLKAKKRELLQQNAYAGEPRREIAARFGKLLSYTDEAIARLIARNGEKE